MDSITNKCVRITGWHGFPCLPLMANSSGKRIHITRPQDCREKNQDHTRNSDSQTNSRFIIIYVAILMRSNGFQILKGSATCGTTSNLSAVNADAENQSRDWPRHVEL